MNAPERPPWPFRGNRPRDVLALRAWHRQAEQVVVLEPALPIVDAHHHLYGSAADQQHYRVEDYALDLASGHRVIGTVYVEAFGSAWRENGPTALRSLGEVEMIAPVGATPFAMPHGVCHIAAGIVSNVDLTLGSELAAVLEAHMETGLGRLRGVRQHATYDDGLVGQFTHSAPRHLLGDRKFREGVACLTRYGLSFDALVFHTQLEDVVALADAFPLLPIVLNHVGAVIGVGEYASQRDATYAKWARTMRTLAHRPNVSVKIGGMGMLLCGFNFEAAARPATSAELAHAWQPYIDVCIDAFGPRRCMFESNFPVDKQSCGYTEVWNAFKLASGALSQDERLEVFYRTACRVYRLPELKRLGDSSQASQAALNG